MQTTVRKWGNSLALRLPQHLAEGLRIEEGSEVELAIADQTLVVKPARKTYKLADLLRAHKKSKSHAEVDWGPPKGREIW